MATSERNSKSSARSDQGRTLRQFRSRRAMLDAAEFIFGSHGFEAATMRQISRRAKVSQALLHYHYKSKSKLYEAVFERRGLRIRDARTRALDELSARENKINVEMILDILFHPLDDVFEERHETTQHYLRMIAEVTSSDNSRASKILAQYYDPTARRFISAFQRAVPRLTEVEAIWCYLFASAARLQAHSLNGRARRLSSKTTVKSRSAYELLKPFVLGGIQAVAARK